MTAGESRLLALRGDVARRGLRGIYRYRRTRDLTDPPMVA